VAKGKKKKKKDQAPARPDPNQMLEQLEQPAVKWRTVGLVVAAFVVIWGLAVGLRPYGLGWWGIGGAAILTAVAAGVGLYIWRLTRKSRAIVDILKSATDEEGRQAALAKLEGKTGKRGKKGKGGDAMNALGQAQLVARDKPQDAIRILEGIDLKKAPAVVQDDVRANLALLYLMNNRARDARELADDIRLDRQPQAKAKAMYAAVCAEAFARTGSPDEALKLIETYDAEDPEYGEMRAMLYRAQVYTYTATRKRGLAKKALEKLGRVDPNMVAAFAQKSRDPQIQKAARQILQRTGAIPKQKMKVMRR